jgi:putative ABC transport system permease protein
MAAPPSPPRRIAFAWRALAHRKLRTAVGVCGIAFAIVFVFLQLGLRGAVTATALAVSARLDGELVLVSTRFVHLGQSGDIPRSRVYQALAAPEVLSVTPLYTSYARWRNPATERNCDMFALAWPVSEPPPLRVPGLAEAAPLLGEPGSVVADQLSQEKCGVTAELREVEVRERPTRVVGRFALGVGFLGDGAIVCSDDTFAQIFAGRSLDVMELGLVRLRPGSDAGRAAAALQASLPPDTRVLPLAELNEMQTRYWVNDTSIGAIFSVGAVVGFLVGTIVLFQVLSTDIRTQLAQYATLKAIGFGNGRIALLVLQQAWLYALLGYVPGLALGLALYALTWETTRLPVAMTVGRAAGVLAASLVMCGLSGLLSLRRVTQADPAELF